RYRALLAVKTASINAWVVAGCGSKAARRCLARGPGPYAHATTTSSSPKPSSAPPLSVRLRDVASAAIRDRARASIHTVGFSAAGIADGPLGALAATGPARGSLLQRSRHRRPDTRSVRRTGL